MNYKQKTDYLGIPVLGWGDRIHPDVEMRKWRIVENMLVAGTQGVKDCVFDDGDFIVEKDGEETFKVRLLATGATPAAHGLVDGFYFNVPSEIVWSGLRKGYPYFLYVVATHSLPYERSAVQTSKSESIDAEKGLLMATVDLRETVLKVEPYPAGKVYSQDIARHCTDTVNPHGRSVSQDEAVVRRLVLTGEVVVGDNVVPLADFAAAAASVAGRRVEKFDFTSGGPAGVVLKASGAVHSVTVHRRSVGTEIIGTVGDVAVGYFGEDPEADEAAEFCVRNAGDAGVPMRAVAICG